MSFGVYLQEVGAHRVNLTPTRSLQVFARLIPLALVATVPREQNGDNHPWEWRHPFRSDDNSNGDTIFLGNGVDDTVSAAFSQYDTICLGNGSGDSVNLGGDTPFAAGSQYDVVTLGNGADDSVSLLDGTDDTITVGNGAGDTVNANFYMLSSVITLGSDA